MTEFLTTAGISHRLDDIIKSAKDRLVIISPFIRVNPLIKHLLEDRNRFNIDIRVIYGKNELHPEENNWLESMASIRTRFCKNLHAKCYLNENEALLTSMNLYEYSQSNNYEMGILVSRKNDLELYNKIDEESKLLWRLSEEISVTVAKVEATEAAKRDSGAKVAQKRAQPASETPKNGFCIRCKADLPAKPTQPYCRSCFAMWNRFKNESYEEKYCHTCGKSHAATLLKPLCSTCFRKYKDAFEFAVG